MSPNFRAVSNSDCVPGRSLSSLSPGREAGGSWETLLCSEEPGPGELMRLVQGLPPGDPPPTGSPGSQSLHLPRHQTAFFLHGHTRTSLARKKVV